MRFLFLCNEYPPFPHGGIGSFVHLLSQQLVEKGHLVDIIGLYKLEKEIYENINGVNIYRLPASYKKIFGPFENHYRLTKKILKLNKALAYDLVEGNELSFSLFLRTLPIKKIIRIQGGHLFFRKELNQKKDRLIAFLEKRSFLQADYFCAVSNYSAEVTRGLHKKLIGNHIEILPNPVDTNLFRPYPEIKEMEKLIIFTGVLREKKGVIQLAQAMPKIIEKHPDVQLWIQGMDTNDSFTGESVKSIIEKSLSSETLSHIEFHGPVNHKDLPKLNALASILVFPSWIETQGIVVIEGLACGKPVIASRTGPGSELINDGIDGLLCDPYSPQSIAEKIIQLLDDSDLRNRLGERARRKALENFSTSILVEKNIEFYKSCLNLKRF